jgi:hypothetical protein
MFLLLRYKLIGPVWAEKKGALRILTLENYSGN